ncbi:MAG TPA: Ig-like domain-containing protein [Gaiellaceae bacterium]|nr:Ig-like domain-containing protein [Gaiellaceae bacterium]
MRRRGLLVSAVALLVLCFPVADGAADLTTPTITGSTPASPANNNSPVLSGTAPPLATVDVFTDSACTAPPVATTAADALGAFQVAVTVGDGTTTTFYATATDVTGTSGCSSGFTYVEDSTPPAAPSITSGPPALVASSSASFTFSDPDPALLTCSLDGGSFEPCASPQGYSGLAEDQHTFQVQARDAAGNPSLSSLYSWTVDTKPPPAPVVETGPTDPSASQSASFTFTDSEPVTFACSLDGGSFVGCSSPRGYSGLPDGQHTFQVQATDAAGNSSTSKVFSWTVDTAHPLVTVTDKPPLITNQTSASFSFSATQAPGRYECRLDGAAFAACTSPKLYTGLGDGSHTFSVRTVSTGGSASAATEYTWTIDTVAPETAIASGPPASSGSATATFGFTSTEAGSAFFCSLDAAGFTPCTSPTTYTGLGNGAHTFRVQAVDAAGNTDATPATATWTVVGVGPASIDRTPPANVGRLRRRVAYGRLQLRWTKPPDADFDHVAVYVSTNAKTAPRKLVYSGTAPSYHDHRFKNGGYHRYLVVSYDHAKNASRGSDAIVPPSALLQAPRNGSALRRPPTFRWAPVRGASFYNVQLFRRGSKVLSAWPKKPHQSLTRRWTYLGRRHALRPGTYVWYVWPGFGPERKSRYGQLLGQGTFRVP